MCRERERDLERCVGGRVEAELRRQLLWGVFTGAGTSLFKMGSSE